MYEKPNAGGDFDAGLTKVKAVELKAKIEKKCVYQ